MYIYVRMRVLINLPKTMDIALKVYTALSFEVNFIFILHQQHFPFVLKSAFPDILLVYAKFDHINT